MAFRKNLITIELFHQPNMHVVIAIVHHSLCVNLPVHSMYWQIYNIEKMMNNGYHYMHIGLVEKLYGYKVFV